MNEPMNGASLPGNSNVIKLVISWLIVGVPSLWAVWQVIVKTVVLFQ
jgi:hypothetical protein